ncbi:MAG TPA: hypothetical protein PLU36_06095 [Chitinophagaceae bacterium]|nr:hypothetical protein [Chitinophagaceae bacterium]MCC6634441.1 hemerythrin domain-containing protein [Chitinophagaceae bacterium]HMZ46357.1 hypothetical protein [Chitinophagaceae bacterium]HNE93666.1 hypothetical protein [Chitinophagaceae bacterium]HNF29686.1 hypothetical protein [Chitinophagaceae bacterium]
MNKPLHDFFTKDHHRLEGYLVNVIEADNEINVEYYHLFRKGLLRHIKMEEKILFPAAAKVNKELVQKIIPQFRLEHGALTALLVPPPTKAIINAIQFVLNKHDFEEEKDGGLYDICEALTIAQTNTLLQQLIATEEVPLHPPNPAPIALESAIRALQRAGYVYDEICK